VSRYLLGLVKLHKPGKFEARSRAEADLREAVRLAPDFAPAYDALAHLYSDSGDGLEEAADLEARAIELDGDNAAYRITMGKILLATRHYDEAASTLRRAVQWARTPEEARAARALLASLPAAAAAPHSP
jgi:Tfp pilus assembly protein PilF